MDKVTLLSCCMQLVVTDRGRKLAEKEGEPAKAIALLRNCADLLGDLSMELAAKQNYCPCWMKRRGN
jgi:hypothetical protein